MKLLKRVFRILSLSAIACIVGCSPNASTRDASTPKAQDVHAHPSEGPHHGDLIELGNEEYHAEVVHDHDAGTVTIYVLDGAATKQVPIDATEVTINAKHDGKPEQFTLKASPDANDPAGKSSRFSSSDPELAHHLDEESFEPRLVLSINGKSYRGAITHSHEADAHKGHKH